MKTDAMLGRCYPAMDRGLGLGPNFSIPILVMTGATSLVSGPPMWRWAHRCFMYTILSTAPWLRMTMIFRKDSGSKVVGRGLSGRSNSNHDQSDHHSAWLSSHARGLSVAHLGGLYPDRGAVFLEEAAARTVSATLPQSGVRVMIGPKPVLTEGDIVNVELMQVELGKCLMFQLTPAAARDLYRISGSNQGRRLVLFVNDVAVGARRMEGPLAEGRVFVFVEMADAALPGLVENIKKTSVALQRAAARKE